MKRAVVRRDKAFGVLASVESESASLVSLPEQLSALLKDIPAKKLKFPSKGSDTSLEWQTIDIVCNIDVQTGGMSESAWDFPRDATGWSDICKKWDMLRAQPLTTYKDLLEVINSIV